MTDVVWLSLSSSPAISLLRGSKYPYWIGRFFSTLVESKRPSLLRCLTNAARRLLLRNAREFLTILMYESVQSDSHRLACSTALQYCASQTVPVYRLTRAFRDNCGLDICTALFPGGDEIYLSVWSKKQNQGIHGHL